MAALRKRSVKGSEKKENYVIVDYPKENETITTPNYTIRIGASEGSAVEVSIDAGNWESCRPAEGYWWYDWADYAPGFHLIRARIRDNKGKIVKTSSSRGCRYQP